MNTLRKIAVLAVSVFLASGCASNGTLKFDHWSQCALAGGLAGGVIGAADEGDSVGPGILAGAVISGVVCTIMGDQTTGATQPRAMADSYVDGDADNDGVLNSMDACPNTQPGIAVDNSGCQLADRITLEGVNFYQDSARLTETSRAILDNALRILLRHPELSLEVAGHTDSQGPDIYNLDLSQRRAEVVRAYLVRRGANPARLTAIGYGESEPVADNGTREGRAYNRRVELRQSY